MKHAVKHIHFVGIGGAGMSGIAEILHNLGYAVIGSDQSDERDDAAPRRRSASRVAIGHDAAHIAGAEAVVTSTAVRGRQPRGASPRARARIPVVPRAVMLAELMRLKQGIAIAGTHGKTTTTWLVTSVLAEAGARPDLRDRRPARTPPARTRGSARATTSSSRPTSRTRRS